MKNVLPVFMGMSLLLTACIGENNSPTYPHGNDSYSPRPTNPTYSFADLPEYATIAANNEKTSIYTRNEKQVTDYINYRLNQWDDFYPNTGKDINRIDIANAALYLTNPNLSETEIKNYFSGKKDLFHMAVYAMNNLLDRCFDSGTNSVKCFVQWRDSGSGFKESAQDIKDNAVLLVADGTGGVVLNTLDNQKLTFILDDTSGAITGMKLADESGENQTIFNNGWSVSPESGVLTNKQLDFVSVGKDYGLTYSDFGYYRIYTYPVSESEGSKILTDKGLFAGGYESKQIKNPIIPEDGISFTGGAQAIVTSGRGGADMNNSANFNGIAYLNVNESGDIKLQAHLTNWYTVTVNAGADDTGADFTFSNYASDTDIYRFAEETNGEFKTDGQFNLNYYGPNPDNNVPTEATGFANVDAGANDIKMDMSFGVTAQY